MSDARHIRIDDADAYVGRHGCPEVALWRSVIEMALRDACGGLCMAQNPGASQRIRRQARGWFVTGNWQFRFVCALAGLDSEAVRHAALRKLREADNGTLSQ